MKRICWVKISGPSFPTFWRPFFVKSLFHGAVWDGRGLFSLPYWKVCRVTQDHRIQKNVLDQISPKDGPAADGAALLPKLSPERYQVAALELEHPKMDLPAWFSSLMLQSMICFVDGVEKHKKLPKKHVLSKVTSIYPQICCRTKVSKRAIAHRRIWSSTFYWRWWIRNRATRSAPRPELSDFEARILGRILLSNPQKKNMYCNTKIVIHYCSTFCEVVVMFLCSVSMYLEWEMMKFAAAPWLGFVWMVFHTWEVLAKFDALVSFTKEQLSIDGKLPQFLGPYCPLGFASA